MKDGLSQWSLPEIVHILILASQFITLLFSLEY